MTILKGWGGYPAINANISAPSTEKAFREMLSVQVIARGMGRSYGDSANAAEVIDTKYLNHFISFDKQRGTLTCESGVTIREILKIVVPNGWFISVTPGTSYVTLGGAIASDVHGKNHHIAGTFCKYVRSMKVLLGTGEIVTTSPTLLPDLFFSTCGGMGLTGIIMSATIKLLAIKSSHIVQTTLKTRSIKEVCEKFDEYSNASYLVAWIDSLAKGMRLGKSILIIGEHEDKKVVPYFNQKSILTIPRHVPSCILNKMSLSTFNYLYYKKGSHNSKNRVSLSSYFYPLDSIQNWNKLYGKTGFVQYQFVLPEENGLKNLHSILNIIENSGLSSFLAVLKKFGHQNNNLLSFPMAGYTISLDFKWNTKTKVLFTKLDPIVAGMGGRVYLTKDATMSELTFKTMYPQWERFEIVREKYSAIGHFASAQSKRLGLS